MPNDCSPTPNNKIINEERSEREHKELVTTANKGIEAVHTLKRKYGEQTIVQFPGERKPTALANLPVDMPKVSIKP